MTDSLATAAAEQRRDQDLSIQFTRTFHASSTRLPPRLGCKFTLTTRKIIHTVNMPHSIPPESTPADESSSREMSQADDIKPEPESEPEPEPETQDATMDDAPSPPAPAEKSKAILEELFDDDSDGEFASSAPVKSEEDASQPAPV